MPVTGLPATVEKTLNALLSNNTVTSWWNITGEGDNTVVVLRLKPASTVDTVMADPVLNRISQTQHFIPRTPPAGHVCRDQERYEQQQRKQQSYQHSDMEELKPNLVARIGKKRVLEEEEFGPSGDFGGGNSPGLSGNHRSEMQKMLEVFGADISKTNTEKKKRLEHLTQASLKSTAKKVEQIWRGQQTERTKLQEEYCRQAESVFSQWNTDIEKMKEQEEKLTNVFKQQQKVFQQTRVIQGQRLKTIRQLNEQFVRGLDELEKNHLDQHNSVQSELKKEMALLQKRILMDMQQREVSNMRKSLQTMLF